MISRIARYLRARTLFCHVSAIVLAGLLTLLPGTSLLPLLDRDEPRFARATIEMIERGTWAIPYFNGEYRFDKPILTYWLMRVAYTLCGFNEMGARLHAVICAILVALAIYAIGRAWFSAMSGWWGALSWLTAVQTLIHGRCALADMPMVLGVVMAQWGCYALLQYPATPFPRLPFLACYGGMAFGVLAKGPVAPCVVALTLALLRFVFWRKPLAWAKLRFVPGLCFTLALVSLWGIPALIMTQGMFWQVGIGKHVISRGLETFNGRVFVPVVYYLATFFFSLYPWSSFAGQLAHMMRQEWNEKLAYLAAWFVAPYLIFGCCATQLPHYVMPAFPAFCLVLGELLARPRATSSLARYWFVAVVAVFTLLSLAMLAMAYSVHLPAEAAGLIPAMSGVALALLALNGLGIQLWRGQKHGFAVVLALFGVGAGGWLIADGLRHSLVTAKLFPQFAELPAKVQCTACKFNEPSLVFYSNHYWQMASNSQELRPLLQRSGRQLIVIKDSEMKLAPWLWQSLRGLPTTLPATQETDLASLIGRFKAQGYRQLIVEGFNPARGTWVRLRVLERLRE
jgi:4-amino-4-deoxy-L-arabinose transferase-like glycosyltransferase